MAEVGKDILAFHNIEGVTFSGGEPFQQAEALVELCRLLKDARPELSLSIFSGYTIRELTTGRWQFLSEESGDWKQGTKELFERIQAYLDFGVFGRFSRALATSDTPLCGSRNQDVIFFNDRYSARDLEPQACEINISEDGERLTVTGFPPSQLVSSLLA